MLKLLKSKDGNCYAVVFEDYLTQWLELFPVKDQIAATIAALLVEQIVSRHGIPTEILMIEGKPFCLNYLRKWRSFQVFIG